MKILVVDDEPTIRNLVKALLVKARYKVVLQPSGAEALQALEDDVDGFDCIVTDALMPGMSGYELVQAVRRHGKYSKIPILMLTRKNQREDVKRAVEAGVTDYVVKPIDEHLLLDKLSLCLKRDEGVRHIYECALSGEQSKAEIAYATRVAAISESGLTLEITHGVAPEHKFRLESDLFKEIGIETPLLKFLSADTAEGSLFAQYSFVGVKEADLRKIRSWIQKQEIARRK